MTEERLKEIYRDVSHSAHEEMSTDNIHLMAMKQAVNEAIQEAVEKVFWKTEMINKDQLQEIADQLKVK